MLGERIAKLRKQKDLSQYELAERLGFSRGKLSNYEQGTRQPDYDTLQKLADFFEVSVDYLLGRNDKRNVDNIDKALEDPELGLWFKDISDASPEKREELRQFWEFIQQKEKERKPGDKQK